MKLRKLKHSVQIIFIFLLAFNMSAIMVQGQLPGRDVAFQSFDRAIKDCIERGNTVLSGHVYETRSSTSRKFLLVCSDMSTVEIYYQGSQDIILMGGRVKATEETSQGTRMLISYTYNIAPIVQEVIFHLYPTVVLGSYPTTGGNSAHCQMWSGFRGSNSINTLLCGG